MAGFEAVTPGFGGLPEVVYIDNRPQPDSTERPYETPAPVVALKRGRSGYFPVFTRSSAEDLNDENVTDAHIEAMKAGALFGWHVPAANPDYWAGQGVAHPAGARP